MRHLRYMPFTLIAGVHGFIFFAPYTALILAAYYLRQQRRRARAASTAQSPAVA